MKPPPPILPAVGWTTASANAVATAASTAVPPSLIASAPMRDAISFCDATMPSFARIGTDPARSVRETDAHATATNRNRVVVMTKPLRELYGGSKDPHYDCRRASLDGRRAGLQACLDQPSPPPAA